MFSLSLVLASCLGQCSGGYCRPPGMAPTMTPTATAAAPVPSEPAGHWITLTGAGIVAFVADDLPEHPSPSERWYHRKDVTGRYTLEIGPRDTTATPYRARYTLAVAPAGQAPQQGTSPGVAPTGGFLATLNAWRARHGRGPVGWDAGLAAAASTNNVAGHAPHSVRGASGQCWAGHADEMSALHAWFASPPHAAILLAAHRAVGCSRCPTGYTLNAD